VSLVEQKLITITGHMSPSPGWWCGSFSSIFTFLCSFFVDHRLSFWSFFFNTILLSVPWFTASDYLFGTFSLIPLYCLSLDLRLLITSLVLFFNTIVLSVPWFTASGYLFWYFFLNTIVLSVPRFTASDYFFGTFSLIPLYCLSLHLRLLITSLVLFL
jgi:hypothetical protein